jgi:hypothetical protein
VVGADRQLVLGQDHPVARDAAQPRLAERRPVGHHRAGPGDRHGLAGGDVGRAAHDLRRLGLADVNGADGEAVGVGVPLGGQHRADDEAVERRHAVTQDAVDLRAGHRQARSELARLEAGSAVLVQPLERDPHPNCSKKRRSLS